MYAHELCIAFRWIYISPERGSSCVVGMVPPWPTEVRPKTMVITMSENYDDLRTWIVNHNRDYGAVRSRLEMCRNVLMHGRIDAAADMLRKSYINAVMSIQTGKDRHERAFTAYFAGGKSLKDAFLETVYGGQKYGWVSDTFDSVDFDTYARAVRSHMRAGRWETLLEVTVDMLKGVSYRKASFLLAMVGCYEYVCVDTNVGQFAGVGDRDADGSAREYLDVCRDIVEPVGLPLPAFVVQWAIYDMQRGEHARHMPFYREIFPAL
jgi:hypothetical protein